MQALALFDSISESKCIKPEKAREYKKYVESQYVVFVFTVPKAVIKLPILNAVGRTIQPAGGETIRMIIIAFGVFIIPPLEDWLIERIVVLRVFIGDFMRS